MNFRKNLIFFLENLKKNFKKILIFLENLEYLYKSWIFKENLECSTNFLIFLEKINYFIENLSTLLYKYSNICHFKAILGLLKKKYISIIVL